jgi:hypothetical protein
MKTIQRVLDLKPTQFAVGMMEVDEKIKSVSRLKKKERKVFVKDTRVPVIKGPDGCLYVVDHHHFLCVCYHVGICKVRVKVIADLSKRNMTYSEFWSWMTRNRKSYPFCQFGEGPRSAIYLPKDVRGLADDPYRSVAWFVRKAGGFSNSDKNFAEFTWANFFRGKKLLERDGMPGLDRALVKAVALAQSPEASKLPGFGKLNLAQQGRVKNAARRKGAKVADTGRPSRLSVRRPS